ncbi:hypothetical protein CS053_08600 [Rhodanobacter glycinis]|uniref:Uncharacterized protein n=1 Tax=Rhodanobacter glycinis TaxID=582702 RepID=A0A5B9E2R9_9GAMM|nr:hypothetical protein [Rhodanobacter glycinis]QEE24556.1 hypothetical protein CS053_08600 [Rhodanobacter glycinis]
MSAVRKLTAEQRASRVWRRPKLHLAQVTPVEQEPEIVSPRVQNVALALVWVCMLVAFGARMAGWLP